MKLLQVHNAFAKRVDLAACSVLHDQARLVATVEEMSVRKTQNMMRYVLDLHIWTHKPDSLEL